MLSVVDGYRRSGLFEDANVQLVITHDAGGIIAKLIKCLLALVKMMRALLFNSVSGVHLHAAMRGSFWRKSIYGTIARAFGVPVVYHLHGSEMKPFVESLGAFPRRLLVHLLENSNAVIVLSASWQQYVQALAPRSNVVIIPNYVVVGPAPIRPLERTISFLFLGALGARKGIYDLLPAFAHALQRRSDLRLNIGGDGELLKAQELAAQLGINQHVIFMGWISGNEKLQALRQADVFVLPSYNEGLPMSILEAMASSLPVIATRVGGIPEAVSHGHTGLLFDAGDQTALSAALLALADSEARRTAMGSAGYSVAEQQFSEQVVVPRIKRLYSELGMM